MRRLLLVALAALWACADAPAAAPAPAPEPPFSPSREVSPFIGSGGYGFSHGSCFPGAVAPHGLAKVGPDTSGEWGTVRFHHFSGYWYGDDVVQGFSHTHLHGTGATDGGAISVMPTEAFIEGATDVEDYESSFRKETESASPGRYAVTLDRSGIRAEIVATERAAIHRFSWPAGAPAGAVILDLGHHLDGGTIGATELVLDPATNRLRGKLRSLGSMSGGFGGFDVFFEAETSAPWSRARVWHDGVAPADGTSAAGLDVGAALDFDVSAPVLLRLGLSLVSAEGAAANLQAEIPDFDWEGVAAATEAAWDERLGRIRLTGGTAAERRTFYTSLYHSYLMPTLISDRDGSWVGPDGEVRVAPGGRQLSDLSLWDTYRTVHPLYDLLDHGSAADSVRSLHEFAKVAGYFPKWPIGTGEAGTMIGASAESVVADAALKGVPGIDSAGAYEILRAAAADRAEPAGGRGGRSDVLAYLDLGYVPASRSGSVSRTTEYAQGDYALSRLAGVLGEREDELMFRERSRGYRALFDPGTGFLRGRLEDGSFALTDFDPLRFTSDYVEANAWHSVWMAAHDVEGLAALFGGPEPMIARLSEFFEEAEAELSAIDPDDLAARALTRPYYWHGNEPDIHAAYLFAQLGRPELTQAWVRWIEDSLYSDQADGVAGNDDGGTLGAWYVFSALGLYPIPGGDAYVLGAPRFPRAELALPSGATLVIEGANAGPEAIYVQAVTLDGVAVERAELLHSALVNGGTLRFELGPAPSAWGRF